MADFTQIMDGIGSAARDAAVVLSRLDMDAVNRVLLDIADAIIADEAAILAANAQDVAAGLQKGLSPAMVDRLTLNPARVKAMADGVRDIAALPDPVGRVLENWVRPNGLRFEKVSVPIGVLGMIYESRPNVTVDAAALCLKSRNAVILRGGSESFQSSTALHHIIAMTLARHQIPVAAVSMAPTADRDFVGAMLAAVNHIDVMIPRGGKSLVARIQVEARMPVFAHLDGINHLYLHETAKPDLARDVIVNAKMRRTGVCGAAETLLIDRKVDRDVAQKILQALVDAGCAIVGDVDAQKIHPAVGVATEDDWRTEYLDAKISVRVVDGVDQAIDHVNHYGSHHTDSILCEDMAIAEKFLSYVDSAIVLHNASTQFADGGEFGFGAEIGIATGRFHARGPVGAQQLTTYKYVVRGNGQTRPV